VASTDNLTAVSQLDEADDAGSEPARTAWNLAEIVAVVLLAILLILIVASIISALATQSLFAPATVVGPGRHLTVGLALERAGPWAAPQSAAFFVLGSLALAWWQIESWTNDDGDPFDAEAFVHLRRVAIVTRIDLVLSWLTIVGGVLVVVGTSLQESPHQNWSLFAENLGIALGSVVLGVVGLVAARRLQASGSAAAETWHPAPAPAPV
jgi:hypothetical protein